MQESTRKSLHKKRVKEGSAKTEREFDQKVVDIARVTRVTKGGKRFGFRATVVVGDHKGSVGVGVGRGTDVSGAIEKGVRKARKYMVKVPMKGNTIVHEVRAKYNSARVLLKPARKGNGIKAGGVVRVIANMIGIADISSKLISRTTNKINIARATMKALGSFRHMPRDI